MRGLVICITLALLCRAAAAHPGHHHARAAEDTPQGPATHVGTTSAGIAGAVVGPGATDAGTHQLVRTSTNRTYVVPFTCNQGYSQCGPNSVRVYRADQTGIATSYTAQDVAHEPQGGIRSSAIAIDGQDVLHIVWLDVNGAGHVNYAQFNTSSGKWGHPRVLRVTNWTDATIVSQGVQGVSIAVDSVGVPHVLYTARASASASAPVRVYYTNRAGGAWSHAVAIDTQAPPRPPRYAYHPTMAFTQAGDLLTAWIVGSCSVQSSSACYTPDGVLYTRLRSAAGAWQATATLPDTTFASIDNGPSLLVTPDGTRHLTFTNAATGHEDEIRYYYDNGTGWRGDQQPPTQVTHDPVLGPDGQGGIYIYGHGTPEPIFSGYGPNKYYFHKPAGGAWGPWTLYATGPYDDASSTRWSQYFHYFPTLLDITYWTATTPYTLSVGTQVSP